MFNSAKQPNLTMHRIPCDVDGSNRFQETLVGPTTWSQVQQAPPIPPRNYHATSSNMYHNSAQPSYIQRPYGGDYMGMYGGGGGYMPYRGGYMNRGYPSPYTQDNHLMPGRYIQMAQDLFSPVFQNSDHMINSLRDITYTADTALVSVRMLFDALNMVSTNIFKVRDFLQKYFVSFVTLSSSHWIFHLIHKLLCLFGIVKHSQTQMDNIWNQVQSDDKSTTSSVIGSLMALSALITAFSYVLPRLVDLLKRFLPTSNETNDDDTQDWSPESDKFTPVQAKYNFTANNPTELSITAGTQLRMKPFNVHDSQLPLWVLVADSNFNKGFVPLSYLTPINTDNRV